ADAAYPLQSNPAIETIVIHTDQLEAVKYVADLIDQAEHIDANIFIDKEMSFVPENKAKGIDSYRENLKKALKGRSVKPMLQEEIINTLRSEEHTSELQSRENLVCRLLLEKKKASK